MNSASELLGPSLDLSHMLQALFFVVLSLGVSKFLKLKMETDILIASFRTAVQLILIGYVLGWLFKTNSIGVNLLVLLIMNLVAAQALYARLRKRTLRTYVLAFCTLVLSITPSGLFTVLFVFQNDSLKNSGIFIPFMGVLMGNALAAVSLAFIGLEKMQDDHKNEIENLFAMGATLWEACHRVYREIFRNALTPLLNGMTIVGVVSLPGIMAGQLLGGVAPLQAAKFQIYVMFLMLIASLMGVFTAVLFHHFLNWPQWMLKRLQNHAIGLQSGDRWFLVGPSGSGKSRLLKSWVGLDHPELQNFQPHLPKPTVSSTGIRSFYLPQKPFFIPGTVEDNLKWPFQFQFNHGMTYDPAMILAWLKKFDLDPGILNRSSAQLSGGEAQILHLIRTLQLKPSRLYLDEPSASLDPQRVLQLERFLVEWTGEGNAFVMVSHNTEQVKNLATHSFHIRLLERNVTSVVLN